jgi:hypothetical protein
MNYLASVESARLLIGVLGSLSVLSFVATKLSEVAGRRP